MKLTTKISIIMLVIWATLAVFFYYASNDALISTYLVLFISVIATIVLWCMLQYRLVNRIEKVSNNISSMVLDPLTGLANRNLLYQSFTSSVATSTGRTKKIAILYIDIDHFKRFNDSLGHDAGDEILIAIAKRLTTAITDNDLAARLGGDEFVVMLTNVRSAEVETITKRIFNSINQPLMHNKHELTITCSMGVCIYPDDGVTIAQLINQADIALYHAKEQGRHRYQFYSESLSLAIRESHQIGIALQNALEHNQLVIYYQPIYDLRTKQIASLEALIRWNHPEKGLLGADDIIPLAERIDLINPLGEWVLNEVCRQLQAWKKKNIPLVPVAINIASGQLNRPGLSKKIIQIIQREEINASLIQCEITETGFIDITPKLINELAALNAFGIKLIIDDFGTGYSGLGYLKSLPVSKLKIDQSFIRDLLTDSDDKAITLAIIAIAHELNLRVTAEGIENVEQYNFMCHHQVDEVQGHYLSKPLDAEECEKILSGE